MAQSVKKIRELMPPNYGPELVKRTGCHLRHAYRVVNAEATTSDIWPYVLELAEEWQTQMRTEKRKLVKLKSAA